MMLKFAFILLMLVLSGVAVFVVARCFNVRLVKSRPFVARCDREMAIGVRVSLIMALFGLLGCLYFLSIGPVIYLFDALVGDNQQGAGATIDAVFSMLYKPLVLLSENCEAFDEHILMPYILVWWQPPFQLGA